MLQIILPDNPAQQIGKLVLQKIVRLLNEGFDKEYPLRAEAHANLIQLVKAWQDALVAPRTPYEQQYLPPKASVPVLLKMKFPPGCPNWVEIQKLWRPILGPSRTGLSASAVYTGKIPWSAWDAALRTFFELLALADDVRDKFGGPCARCGRYYIKKRASQKVYCSRTCGNAATAVVRTRKKWDEERGERLKQADKAMRKWSRLKTTETFQDWAEKRYPTLTKKFLTRAIHNEELPIRKGRKTMSLYKPDG